MSRIFLSTCFIVITGYSGFAQSLINWELIDMPLKELVNIKVEAASNESSNLKTSPAILTVLTEEEIKHSGASSLMELLKLIPGFDFSAEWDNIIGLGIRGNNATEGKYLILLDGMQLNETNFGTFSFQNHFLTDNIKKIEVIRGPGSVIYGGMAELSVINIITKNGADLNGNVESSVSSDIENMSYLKSNIQVAYGNSLKKDFNYKIAASYNTGNNSNQMVTTLDTNEINYHDSSHFYNGNFNFQVNYKKLVFIFLYDNYSTENTEAIGFVSFDGVYSGLSYSYNLSEKLELKPYIKYSYQKPWFFVNYPEKEFYNTINQQLNSGLSAHYALNKKVTFIIGGSYNNDASEKQIDTVVFNLNNQKNISFARSSLFSEAIVNTKFGYLNLGIRYDYHSHYKGNFVPRIAYTKSIKNIHLKLLYSNAYKAPTISNIDYNPEILPELTRVYEMETGILLKNKLNFTLNLFDILIKHPIIYIPDPTTGADSYINSETTGSKGFEFTGKYLQAKGYISLSYAYYKKNNNTVDEYNIESNDKAYGAFPQHCATLVVNYALSPKFTLGSTSKFMSKRYTYIHSNKNWSELSEIYYRPSSVINVFTEYKVKNNWKLAGGVKNITQSKAHYLNPYQGGQNPIPHNGRVFYAKITWLIQSNKSVG
ncbi:MAG: TonB-dependent receptor [Salinivirgaceae bacterium]